MVFRFNKIILIGFGQLGFPVVKYVKEKGFDKYGYDRAKKLAVNKTSNWFR